MATTTTQAQGLVLALFGASAGGHLTGLAAASSLESLAGDLSTSAGMILGKDLSSNTAFRNHVTSNLKLTGDALTAANAWLDGQLNAGAARGDTLAAAVTFLSTLADTSSPFYASAQAFQATVTAAVAWSTGAGATEFGVTALRAQQGNVDVVAGQSFTLTTGTDTFVGTAGNDTVTASASDDNFTAADAIIDNSSTDSDTLNITGKAFDTTITSAGTVRGIENVNVNFDSLSASSFDAAGIDSAATITLAQTRAGSGAAVTVTNVIKGSTVAAGTAVNSLTATADADGNMTVNGSNATTLVSGTVSGTGNVTVNADKAATVTAVSAKSATVTAAAATAVNATGATVAVTTGTKDVAVTLTGTAATTDTASFTASQNLTIANQAAKAETITVSGSGAAVVATVTTTAATTYVASGDQNVTFAGNATMFTGATVTDSSTATSALKLTTLGAAADFSKAAVDSIEVAAAAAAATYTFSDNANVKVSTDTAGAVVLTATDNVANTATSYLKGTMNLDAAVAITGGSVTISNSAASTDGIDTVNLNVSAAQTGLNLIAGTANVVATGSKALVLAATSTAKSLDASAMTGAVTVTFDATNDIATVKTGSGSDTVTLSTAKVSVDTGAGNDSFTLNGTLATGTVVTAGDGTDTLTLGGASNITAATVSGIEIINLAGAALTANASTFNSSAVVIQSAGAAAIALKDIGASLDLSNVTFEHASNGTFSFDFSGADRSLSLGASSNFSFTGSSHADTVVTGNGVNTVNGGAGNDSLTGGASVDTIDGGAGDDTIVGNGGADVLTGGEGADTITGGTGNDTIVLTETTSAVDTVVLATASIDTITGFKSGTDKIDLSAFVASTTETGITAAAAAGTNAVGNAKYFFITTDGTAASLTTSGVKTLAAADYTATTLTNVAAYLSEQFTVAGTAADEAVFVLNDTVSGNAYIYEFTEVNPAVAGIAAAELELVGIANATKVIAGDVI